MERITKTAEAWKHLRPALARWAKSANFKRLKSSPPAYGQALSNGFLTLFAVGSSGGVDAQTLGGTFTVAIQIGEAAMLGVDSCEGVDLRTTRLPSLFSPSEQAQAVDIHNRVIAKRRMPPSHHYLRDIYTNEQIETRFFQPIDELSDLDYWFAFVDEADLRAWGEFLASSLSTWVETLVSETEGRFGKRPR